MTATVKSFSWEMTLFLLAGRLLAIIETTTTDDMGCLINEHIKALADELEIAELEPLEPSVFSMNTLHSALVKLVDELSKLAKHCSDQHKQADAWGEAQLACQQVARIWEVIYSEHLKNIKTKE